MAEQIDIKLNICTFIQARMSSNRLPGKVLMDFNGKPLIRHVIDAAGIDNAVVLTSNEDSDNPLIHYLEEQGIMYFRGSLDNVYGRFCAAIKKFQPEWIMRICADSPLIPKILLNAMTAIKREDADLITNIFPRTFPKGHSVEILRTKTMLNIPPDQLSKGDREHVTPYFYRNDKQFKIISVTQNKNMNDLGLAVDTVEDYDRLIKSNNLGVNYDPAQWKVVSC